VLKFAGSLRTKLLRKVSCHMPSTVVVSGFPGVGKSTLFAQAKGRRILDSDSTDFSWADAAKKVRHPNWPQNYIDHIRNNLGRADIILVSSHDVVRDALVMQVSHSVWFIQI
jgi:adenylate kinase